MTKTWFITGCSAGGIGEGIARGVLKRGCNAVVTARNTDRVKDIILDYPDTAIAVTLDVTSPMSISAAVQKAIEKFGTIDVLVNNAGYAYRSSIEEAADGDVMEMYNTNLFGPVHLIQKILPLMREKKTGAIINISSIGAVRTGAASGFYASSKAALELMSQALAAEVKPLGIKVMVVEPGAFRTHFYDSSLRGSKMTIDAYEDTAWKRSVDNTVNQQNQPGDPAKTGEVIANAIERDDYPFRLLLGSDAVRIVSESLRQRTEEIKKWEQESVKTDF
jgi:NAD(P)-dependent dehydrogenase (short-subunit alcohol dehydrogenase family)